MRILGSITNRIFLASVLLAMLSIGAAVYFVSARMTTQTELELQRVFGKRDGDWLVQIKQTALVSPTVESDESDKPPKIEADSRLFPLVQKIDLNWQPDEVKPAAPRPFDPQAPGSAAEGTAL